MHTHTSRSHFVGALCLAAAATAHAGVVGTPGVEVTLNGWAFGAGNTVAATGYGGRAGAFGGSVLGTGQYDSASFVTYCIELEEGFRFSGQPMTQYSLQAGSDYFARRRHDSGIADRLGRLMTFVADNAAQVDTAAESTSLQLAVWNTVYDTDWSLGGGSFGDTSAYAQQANLLLAGAQGTSTSRFSVWALEGLGTQDFLLLSQNASPNNNTVPEPQTLGLVGAALLAAAAARRRTAKR
jgi:hypothetical protein